MTTHGERAPDGEAVRDWVLAFAAEFGAQSAEFAALDSAMGDGDFADNISGGLSLAAPRIRRLDAPTPGAVLSELGLTFLDEVGGTSGPLFGLLFSSLARAVGDSATLSGQDLARGLRDAVEAIVRVGGASVGDKTLIDGLAPAADAAARSAAHSTDSAATVLRTAADAARRGASGTAQLLARRGRGSYVGEHARGVIDPGAQAVALFLQTASVLALPDPVARPGLNEEEGEALQ